MESLNNVRHGVASDHTLREVEELRCTLDSADQAMQKNDFDIISICERVAENRIRISRLERLTRGGHIQMADAKAIVAFAEPQPEPIGEYVQTILDLPGPRRIEWP